MSSRIKSLIDHTIEHEVLGVEPGGGGGTPDPHTASHQNGGSDEVATATPGANAIPKADAGGKLAAGWMPAAALPEMHVVADTAARLALVVQEGDEAKQLDTGKHWIYDGSTWYEYPDTQLGPHTIGGANHTSDTLANLNSKISDATLDDSSNPRDPNAHDLAGSEHNTDTLANLNSKISDGTLVDTNDARFSDARTPTNHSTSHENGGADEISIAGLSGLLADDQNPVDHASDHQNGGGDEIATVTPGANAIPKAGAGGTLATGWVADGSDGSAIHDNVDAEISAIAEKVTPVDDDVLVLEDSAASFAKKKVKVSNLLGGSVFGTEYEDDASEGESTTTNTGYTNKLTFTTASVPAGNYLIQWNWEIKTSNSAKAVTARIELDDTTELTEDNSKLDVFDATGGFIVVPLTAATHQLDIDFKVVSGATATIRRARVILWRVS